MNFIQSCFVRKNTKELRSKLEKLGYEEFWIKGEPQLFVNSMCGFYCDATHLDKDNRLIDCGENEQLFLAIAALRNDSNYMQWFICMEPYEERIGSIIKYWHQGDFYLFDLDGDFEIIPLPHWRKATVQELIEHFK